MANAKLIQVASHLLPEAKNCKCKLQMDFYNCCGGLDLFVFNKLLYKRVIIVYARRYQCIITSHQMCGQTLLIFIKNIQCPIYAKITLQRPVKAMASNSRLVCVQVNDTLYRQNERILCINLIANELAGTLVGQKLTSYLSVAMNWLQRHV